MFSIDPARLEQLEQDRAAAEATVRGHGDNYAQQLRHLRRLEKELRELEIDRTRSVSARSGQGRDTYPDRRAEYETAIAEARQQLDNVGREKAAASAYFAALSRLAQRCRDYSEQREHA